MQQASGVVDEQVRREAGVHAAITQLIRSVRAETGLHPGSTWAVMTAAAMKLSAVEYASIVRLGQANSVRTLASTDDHLRLLNKLQQRYQQGPSLDAAWENQPRRVDDLTRENRWAAFSEKAVAITPIRSMLCVPLFTHHNGRTALNMYADQPSAFGPQDELIGLTFASDAETILEVGRRAERYRQAQINRELIGLAKGILMARFAVDAVTAFSLLAELSKDRRQPVSVVAKGLVGPGSEGSRRPPSHSAAGAKGL
jgi:GAF domain-containing protein